jgi:glycosyltransferase involved in cell wall biosynthesis
MRVLHVTESMGGGLGGYLDVLMRHQLDSGLEVAVATPSGESRAEALSEAGARYLRWDVTPRPDAGTPRELAALRRIVSELRPELVHLHAAKAGFAGRLVLRNRIPTIFQPHGPAWLAKEGVVRRATLRWERLAARWAAAYLCVSDGERRWAERAGVEARFHVVRNGIDGELWPAPAPGDRRAARERLGLDDAPLVVCSGRLHRQKNQKLLLDEWPEVRREVPGARLALVGDGPDRAELEARGAEGALILGSRPDVRDWLVAASLAAQPSRWDGLSLSVLEAAATARSLVATDVPGMRDVIGDDAGAVVPLDDAGAVRRAIVERLRDPDAADREGARGRARVERDYRLADQLAGVGDLYRSLSG